MCCSCHDTSNTHTCTSEQTARWQSDIFQLDILIALIAGFGALHPRVAVQSTAKHVSNCARVGFSYFFINIRSALSVVKHVSTYVSGQKASCYFTSQTSKLTWEARRQFVVVELAGIRARGAGCAQNSRATDFSQAECGSGKRP